MILVTGGAGFIGSHIVEALLNAGHDVRVLDNLSTGKTTNLPTPPPGRTLHFRHGDIRDFGTVLEAMIDCDAVFHEAAFVSVPESFKHAQECWEINVDGSMNVLDAAGPGRLVVFASSSAVRGAASPYAQSKDAIELILSRGAFNRDGSRSLPPTAALRYFNVYGPRQSGGSSEGAVIPAFLHAAAQGLPVEIHGDGEQTRDFVHVTDVAAANLAILRAWKRRALDLMYEVGSGVETSINDLWHEAHSAVQAARPPGSLPVSLEARHTPARPGDAARSCADPGTLRGLGWAPRVALRDGLVALARDTVAAPQGAADVAQGAPE